MDRTIAELISFRLLISIINCDSSVSNVNSTLQFLDEESTILVSKMNRSMVHQLELMTDKIEIINAINDYEFKSESEEIFKNLYELLNRDTEYKEWIYITLIAIYFLISITVLSLISWTWCQRHKVSSLRVKSQVQK